MILYQYIPETQRTIPVKSCSHNALPDACWECYRKSLIWRARAGKLIGREAEIEVTDA